MSFLKKLFGGKFDTELVSEVALTEAGVCPNCWGKEAYDGKFVDFVKDQTKSNINQDKQNQKAFVQQFIETNLTGIRLKSEGDHQVCLKCKMKYKKVDAKAN